MNVKEIRNAVNTLLVEFEGKQVSEVKEELALLSNPDYNYPDWLLEANIPVTRKKMYLDFNHDMQLRDEDALGYNLRVYDEDCIKNAVLDNNISDEILEEILICYSIDNFNAYELELAKGFDYEHLHQVRLALENEVYFYEDITNDTPIEECIKLRIERQTGAFEDKIAAELAAKASEEDDEYADIGDEGSPE